MTKRERQKREININRSDREGAKESRTKGSERRKQRRKRERVWGDREAAKAGTGE